jgi:sterol desaturase/sphingolipid hydroxylase (fatty acid hydroxylase superfamily)
LDGHLFRAGRRAEASRLSVNEVFEFVWSRVDRMYVAGFPELAFGFFAAAAVFAAVLTIELFCVGWSRSSARALLSPDRSATADIVWFVLVETSISVAIGAAMLLGVTLLWNALLAGYVRLNLLSYVPLAFARFCIYVVILDLLNYWFHRLCHRIPSLWELHKFHHSASQFTVLTATRDHPLERTLQSVFVALPLSLLGPPNAEYVVAALLLSLIGPLKHSRLDWSFGWIGEWLIQSPRAHRVHHSTNPSHYNCNFASVLQLWDKLFRTAAPHDSRAERVGLSADEFVNSGLIRDIWACMAGALRKLVHGA